MEQFHLHQLFQEISSKLICPACNNKISPLELNLENSEGNTCYFEATCNKCGNIAHISAIIEAQITPEGKLMNASSRLHGITHSPITEDEIISIKTSMTSSHTPLKQLFKI